MAGKKKSELPLTLLKIILIIPAVLNLTAGIVAFARREINLLRRKVIFLLFLSVFSLVLFMTVWLCGNGLLLLYLLSIKLELMLTVTFILIFNLLLLVIIFLTLALTRIDLTLTDTRKMIQSIISEDP